MPSMACCADCYGMDWRDTSPYPSDWTMTFNTHGCNCLERSTGMFLSFLPAVTTASQCFSRLTAFVCTFILLYKQRQNCFFIRTKLQMDLTHFFKKYFMILHHYIPWCVLFFFLIPFQTSVNPGMSQMSNYSNDCHHFNWSVSIPPLSSLVLS